MAFVCSKKLQCCSRCSYFVYRGWWWRFANKILTMIRFRFDCLFIKISFTTLIDIGLCYIDINTDHTFHTEPMRDFISLTCSNIINFPIWSGWLITSHWLSRWILLLINWIRFSLIIWKIFTTLNGWDRRDCRVLMIAIILNRLNNQRMIRDEPTMIVTIIEQIRPFTSATLYEIILAC